MPEAKVRVLLVDDNQDMRSGIKYFLTVEGYEVITAEDGLQALEKLKAEEFDVLITDLEMPNMDGMQLLETIFHNEALKIPTMILCSSSVDDKDMDWYWQVRKGPAGFWQKIINIIEKQSIDIATTAPSR